MAILAMWVSRGGAHYAMLHVSRESVDRYSYVADGCGGSVDSVDSDEAAVAIMQARVDSGYFLPDDAKMPMKRIGSVPPAVRIKESPVYFPSLDLWEVTVSLPVYSSKLACRAFNALPEYADFDGRIYRKSGFSNADCTAWYQSNGK